MSASEVFTLENGRRANANAKSICAQGRSILVIGGKFIRSLLLPKNGTSDELRDFFEIFLDSLSIFTQVGMRFKSPWASREGGKIYAKEIHAPACLVLTI